MTRTVIIRAEAHPAQLAIHNCPARFRVVAAGRRFRKSSLGVLECIEAAVRGGIAWWIAPTYSVGMVGWRMLTHLCRQIPGVVIRLGDREIIIGSGRVAIKTASSEAGLRGEGLDFVVFDEAAYIPDVAWTEEIRPALSDRRGRALFISTPNGRNWFWEMYRRGEAGEKNWQSFQYPTAANPDIDPAEIEAARREMPELVFRQEYLAEFVDMEGAVFRRVQAAAVIPPGGEPEPGRQYYGSVDVASDVDYTVISIWDVQAKQQVALDRFGRVDYTVLEDRLAAIYRRWNMSGMIIEINSIGRPVFDHLVSRGLTLIPFTTTSATKMAAIQALQSAFEHDEIKIVADPVQIGELLSFESRRSLSGSYSYSAPEGLHDDCVMSLAIGWTAIGRQMAATRMVDGV